METDMIMLAGATVIGGIRGIYSTLRLIYYIFYMIELEDFFKGRRTGLEIPDPVLQCLYGV